MRRLNLLGIVFYWNLTLIAVFLLGVSADALDEEGGLPLEEFSPYVLLQMQTNQTTGDRIKEVTDELGGELARILVYKYRKQSSSLICEVFNVMNPDGKIDNGVLLSTLSSECHLGIEDLRSRIGYIKTTLDKHNMNNFKAWERIFLMTEEAVRSQIFPLFDCLQNSILPKAYNGFKKGQKDERDLLLHFGITTQESDSWEQFLEEFFNEFENPFYCYLHYNWTVEEFNIVQKVIASRNTCLGFRGKEIKDFIREDLFSLLDTQKIKQQPSVDTVVKNPISNISLSPRGSYPINLMWVNSKRSDTQKFVFPNESRLVRDYISKVFKWMDKGHVFLWYDGNMVSKKAVDTTVKAFTLYATMHGLDSGNITFRDIREIDVVQNHSDAFDESMPIFFRVDLLRLIVAKYLLERNEVERFVYADLDIVPPYEIFDERTDRWFKKFRIIMAHFHIVMMCENSFQIIGRDDRLLDCIDRVIITPFVGPLKDKIKAVSKQKSQEEIKRLFSQIVFEQYDSLFQNFYVLRGWATITQIYNKDYNGISLTKYTCTLKFENPLKVLPIPTKVVRRPPSQFGGGETKPMKDDFIKNIDLLVSNLPD